MVYIKVLNSSGDFVRVEELDSPGYVRYDTVRKCLLRCPKERAEGIISADCSTVYNYNANVGAELTAALISPAEYDTLRVEHSDPEDESPEIPEDAPKEDPPLTRAQLTAKVAVLESENKELREAIEALLSGVTSDE